MSKAESKELLRMVKAWRKSGATWEQVAYGLNKSKIRTVRGLRWKSTNLQAWFRARI